MEIQETDKTSKRFKVLVLIQKASESLVDVKDILNNPGSDFTQSKDYSEVLLFTIVAEKQVGDIMLSIESRLKDIKGVAPGKEDEKLSIENLHALCFRNYNRMGRVVKEIAKHM